jgi:hypothetical protein
LALITRHSADSRRNGGSLDSSPTLSGSGLKTLQQHSAQRRSTCKYRPSPAKKDKRSQSRSIHRRRGYHRPSDRWQEKARLNPALYLACNQRKPKKLKIASTITTAPTSQIKLFMGNRSPV